MSILISKSDSDNAMNKAKSALSKVGTSFTWKRHPVDRGDIVKVDDITELRNAVDQAHKYYRTSRSRCGDKSDRGDDSDDSYCSDNQVRSNKGDCTDYSDNNGDNSRNVDNDAKATF